MENSETQRSIRSKVCKIKKFVQDLLSRSNEIEKSSIEVLMQNLIVLEYLVGSQQGSNQDEVDSLQKSFENFKSETKEREKQLKLQVDHYKHKLETEKDQYRKRITEFETKIGAANSRKSENLARKSTQHNLAISSIEEVFRSKSFEEEKHQIENAEASQDSPFPIISQELISNEQLMLNFNEEKFAAISEEKDAIRALLNESRVKISKLEEENYTLTTKYDEFRLRNFDLKHKIESSNAELAKLKADFEDYKKSSEYREKHWQAQVEKKSHQFETVMSKMQSLNQRLAFTKQELDDAQKVLTERMKEIDTEKNLKEKVTNELVVGNKKIVELKDSITDLCLKFRDEQREAEKMQKDLVHKLTTEHSLEISNLTKNYSEEIEKIKAVTEERINEIKDRARSNEENMKNYFKQRIEDYRKWYDKALAEKSEELSQEEKFHYSQKVSLSKEVSILKQKIENLENENSALNYKCQDREKLCKSIESEYLELKEKYSELKENEAQFRFKNQSIIAKTTEKITSIQAEVEERIQHELSKAKSAYKAKSKILKEKCKERIESLAQRHNDDIKKLQDIYKAEKNTLFSIIVGKEKEMVAKEIECENKCQEILKEAEIKKEKSIRNLKEKMRKKKEKLKEEKKELEEIIKKKTEEISLISGKESQKVIQELSEIHAKEIKRILEDSKRELEMKEELYKKNENLIRSAYDSQVEELRNLLESLNIESHSKEIKLLEHENHSKKEIENMFSDLKVANYQNSELKAKIIELNSEIHSLKYPEIKTTEKFIQTDPEPEKCESEVLKRQRAVINKCQSKIEYLENSMQKMTQTMQANYDKSREKCSILSAQLKQKESELSEIQNFQKEALKKDEIIAKLEKELKSMRKQLMSHENDLNFLFSSANTSASSKSRTSSYGAGRPQTPKVVQRRKTTISRNFSPANKLSLTLTSFD
ncbi:unnamed protein product [Blepharisma stoltei]|uniref:Uncharacterized protein n=1 Tax=Blepharisma stoltei TaxID=1481888 RepID=A0AAU9JDK9_9CILI|nr:unnamed protein product [Blepharisma stoltei]